MSRSNTNYYNVCDHEPSRSGWIHTRCEYGRHCIPVKKFATRRGIVERKKRFPEWSWKSHCPNPPRAIKRAWQQRLRAQMKREIARYGEVMVDADVKLIGWYGWWS